MYYRARRQCVIHLCEQCFMGYILSGNAYLIPAVVQFLTKGGKLCDQRPDGFGPRFHTKVDAAAKSLQIPVKADACHAR